MTVRGKILAVCSLAVIAIPVWHLYATNRAVLREQRLRAKGERAR